MNVKIFVKQGRQGSTDRVPCNKKMILAKLEMLIDENVTNIDITKTPAQTPICTGETVK